MAGTRLKLTIACGNYDRTRALIDGEVNPEGIDLNYLPLVPGETFWRMLNHGEFDASEMSLASYTILRSEGDDRFVAIPVFPSRTFRHSCLYVAADSDIDEPQHLKGKRIGVGDYQMTAAVWVRAFLQHDYGIGPGDMSWVTGNPVRRLEAPRQVEVKLLSEAESLEEMLLEGDIDALISVVLPAGFVSGSRRIRRLFSDHRSVEIDYHRRTGIFPIMHTFVLKRDLYEAHPWAATSLYKAFVEAKRLGESRLYDTNALPVGLPWLMDEIESTRRALGDDFWDYSLEGSRTTLEALMGYLHEQGLTRREMTLQELFVPNIQGGLEDYLDATGEGRMRR